MSEYRISNDQIEIKVNSMGAELVSLQDIKTGLEYMWDGNPKFWKRTSPVLFPIVGSLNKQSYQMKGKRYNMSQHGFARDMEFVVTKKDKQEIRFSLMANEDTLKNYPFLFSLEIGYQLKERSVFVIWKVTNLDNKEMYFSIGGHPAFQCPIDKDRAQTDYFLSFDTKDEIKSNIIGAEGLATNQYLTIPLENGILPITETLFDQDALVIEHHQVQKIALLDTNKKPYLTVRFDAPLVGVWSPPKKNAPFICIEPWYGRCDSAGFEGDFDERVWGNSLKSDEVFEKNYQIEV